MEHHAQYISWEELDRRGSPAAGGQERQGSAGDIVHHQLFSDFIFLPPIILVIVYLLSLVLLHFTFFPLLNSSYLNPPVYLFSQILLPMAVGAAEMCEQHSCQLGLNHKEPRNGFLPLLFSVAEIQTYNPTPLLTYFVHKTSEGGAHASIYNHIEYIKNKACQITGETIFSSRKKHQQFKKHSLEFRSQKVLDKEKHFFTCRNI